MNFETLVTGIIAIVLALFVILFRKELMVLFKGFGRLFIKDIAETPEGAEAIFSEKIDEAQDAYNKADNAHKMAAGKLSNARKDMENLKKRLSKVEADCEALVKVGNMEAATLKAEEREEILSDINRLTELVKAYEVAAQTAKEAQETCERNLRSLKRESKELVENLKTKKALQDVYDNMDELKNVTGTDKLLDTVRERNKDLNAMVEGSRVTHENKLSTKLQKAEAEARKTQSNDYLENLKRKHGK